MAKRLKPGSALEIELEGGTGVLLYLGKHAMYGDAVRVVPRVFSERPILNEDLFGESYVAFYPACEAIRHGLAEIVGMLPIDPIPDTLRRAGKLAGRHVETWIIEGPAGESVKRTLTNKERILPRAEIWNHEALKHRIVVGWTPGSGGQCE